jgi:ferric-dicitrate binding protein FerR (iron transport regulator)
MSKPRVRGTLVTLFFFAAVAVFPSVVQALTSTKATHKTAAGEFRDTGVLMADGGDPVPVPNPIPWSSAVS